MENITDTTNPEGYSKSIDPPIGKTLFKILLFLGPSVVAYSYGAMALVEYLGF